MSTGYFSGGRELTHTEAKALRLPVSTDLTKVPNVTIPRYRSARLVTRHNLLEIFESAWAGTMGANIGLGDVDMFISNRDLKPVDYLPTLPQPVITDDMSDMDASQAFNEWLSQRSVSRRFRQRFDIDGVEAFVPSHFKPSANNTPEANAAAVERIHNLNVEV